MKSIFQTSFACVISFAALAGSLLGQTTRERKPDSNTTWRERQEWASAFSDWYVGFVGVGVFIGPPEARLTADYQALVRKEQETRQSLTSCLGIPAASSRLQIADALMAQ